MIQVARGPSSLVSGLLPLKMPLTSALASIIARASWAHLPQYIQECAILTVMTWILHLDTNMAEVTMYSEMPSNDSSSVTSCAFIV